MNIMCKPWLNFTKAIQIFCFFLTASYCHAVGFTFDDLKISGRFPNKQTLLFLDMNRDFGKKAADAWPQRYDTVRNYLHHPSPKEKFCYGRPSREDAESYYGYLTLERGRTTDDNPYVVVQFFRKHQGRKLEALMDAVRGEEAERPREEFEINAALIFFPKSATQSLVYGFRYWQSLLNPDTIVPQWGLRLLTSRALFNPQRVKEVGSWRYRRDKPCFKRHRTATLEALGRFDLDEADEELEYLRGLLQAEYKMPHLMRGGMALQFILPTTAIRAREDDDEAPNPIDVLHRTANHFFDIFNDPDQARLHDAIRPFLDDRIIDRGLIERLNEKLMDMLSQGQSASTYLRDSVWRRYGASTLFFGERQESSLFHALRNCERRLTDPIKVRRTEDDENVSEAIIGNLIYTLPIEIEGKFYRFSQGDWFEVDKSRFEAIRSALRKRLIPAESLCLPLYEYKDTETEGRGVTYKEANYNRRVIRDLQQPWRGILLDRLLVSLGDAHNVFEFADHILFNGSKIYLVHVKRAGAGDLSHHREQLERCAGFLATELERDNAKNLLVQGAVNHLYAAHQVSSRKDDFAKAYQEHAARRGQMSFEALMKRHILHVPLGVLDQSPWAKFRRSLQGKIDYRFFENHEDKAIRALDALWACVDAKKLSLADDGAKIDDFLHSFQQAIEAQDLLFTNGVLPQEVRARISIVMAVIDDRRIQAILDQEKELKKDPVRNRVKLEQLAQKKADDPRGLREPRKKTPLFKKQDLWGLNQTDSLITRKYGFPFHIAIISDDHDDNSDCFGEIQSLAPELARLVNNEMGEDDSSSEEE